MQLEPSSISVYSFFDSFSLHTREQARELFAAIETKTSHLKEPFYVDFSDIEFISRAFADELVQLRLQAKNKDLIEFCCVSSNIHNMLLAVERTQSKKPESIVFPIHKFENLESLLHFFSE